MDENLDAIRKELKKYSQEHLLTEYEAFKKQEKVLLELEN